MEFWRMAADSELASKFHFDTPGRLSSVVAWQMRIANVMHSWVLRLNSGTAPVSNNKAKVEVGTRPMRGFSGCVTKTCQRHIRLCCFGSYGFSDPEDSV